MDLKIKDVAELLHVSETTVRRWLSAGLIPAYRLQHQYRFSRLEIEDWMMNCKLKKDSGSDSKKSDLFTESEESFELPLGKAGTQQFCLFRAIHKGAVFSKIPLANKEEVIRFGAKAGAEILGLEEDVIFEYLSDRERLMSTALQKGIAVPHPRELIAKKGTDVVVVVLPETPVEFGSLDGEPTYAFFFLFSSEDKKHLQLLAKIAHLSSDPAALTFLQSTPSKEELLDFIRSRESIATGT